MPLNDRKIIGMILEECKGMDERCRGYREHLAELVGDIVIAERQHRTQGTNIQQKIGDLCDAAADFLHKQNKTSAR